MKTKYLIIPAMILLWISSVAPAGETETEQTSDAWLKAKVVTTYTLNEHLNPFTIDVAVTGGVVTLTGTVESDIERDLAGEIAKGVKGVKEVDNQLAVSKDAKRDTERSSFLHYVEDANITASVKSRLLLNPNTQGMKIKVTTKNRVVFLEGELNSEIEADLARQIARNAEGVVDIKDNLTIKKK
ncbi:MAG: BON domain-containing protein [Gammaproteobacteria bacterium]